MIPLIPSPGSRTTTSTPQAVSQPTLLRLLSSVSDFLIFRLSPRLGCRASGLGVRAGGTESFAIVYSLDPINPASSDRLMLAGELAIAFTSARDRDGAKLVRHEVTMGLILLVIVILLLIGALPTWPYSSGWGYYPSGGLGLIVLILIILLLMGRL
jgi:Protein of unknown function (DUF3309)